MDLAKYIVAEIIKLKRDRPQLVAFDGVDASGKSTLADSVYHLLTEKPYPAIRVSIDNFCNPRKYRFQKGALSAEGYFLDSFDYAKVLAYVIKPVKDNGRTIIPGAYDYKTEKNVDFDRVSIDQNPAILIDGIFLHRDELYQYWDLSLYLNISFETMLERVFVRDVVLFGSRAEVELRYLKRYIPGEKIYIEKCNPVKRASIVIDNNDYSNPVLIKE